MSEYLDVQVAEKVMGLGPLRDEMPFRSRYFDKEYRAWVEIPMYSDDMDEAWKVVERVYELGHGWMLVRKQSDGRYVAYEATGCADYDFGDWFAFGESAPEAICRAALAAVGKAVPA